MKEYYLTGIQYENLKLLGNLRAITAANTRYKQSFKSEPLQLIIYSR